MPVVSSLFIYPIKGCAGSSLRRLEFDELGPVGDRRYMLVDDTGRFVTQRTHPQLSRVVPRIHEGGLLVQAPNREPLSLKPGTGSPLAVTVWDYRGQASDQGDAAAKWFSEWLRDSVRLVRFDEGTRRAVSRKHTDRDAQVAFADGYPALLTCVESLVDLNRRLEHPVPMNRFRPNIVVRDCHPFEEDGWTELHGPNLSLSLVKPCDRCVVTTVDQRTAERSKEPLKTLATFRKSIDGVMFGQNCVHHGAGSLSVGDQLSTQVREGDDV